MFLFLLYVCTTPRCPGWNTNNISPKTPNGTFCFQNGNCTEKGECICFKDYYTFNCRKMCNGCTNRGSCSKKGCVCDVGFIGTSCEYTAPQNDIIPVKNGSKNSVCVIGKETKCTLPVEIDTVLPTNLKIIKTNSDVDMFVFGLQDVELMSSIQLTPPPASVVMLSVNGNLFYPIQKSGNGIKLTQTIMKRTTKTHHLKTQTSSIQFNQTIEHVVKSMVGKDEKKNIAMVVGKPMCDVSKCNNVGFCTTTDTCVCFSGWEGKSCASEKKGGAVVPPDSSDTHVHVDMESKKQYASFETVSSTAMGIFYLCIIIDGGLLIKKKRDVYI